MTDRHAIWQTADKLQMNLRACQAQLVELRAMIATLNLEPGWKPPRPGSPRELHPDACPSCEIVGGHTTDCRMEFAPCGHPWNETHRGDELGTYRCDTCDEASRPTPPPPAPDHIGATPKAVKRRALSEVKPRQSPKDRTPRPT